MIYEMATKTLIKKKSFHSLTGMFLIEKIISITVRATLKLGSQKICDSTNGIFLIEIIVSITVRATKTRIKKFAILKLESFWLDKIVSIPELQLNIGYKKIPILQKLQSFFDWQNSFDSGMETKKNSDQTYSYSRTMECFSKGEKSFSSGIEPNKNSNGKHYNFKTNYENIKILIKPTLQRGFLVR